MRVTGQVSANARMKTCARLLEICKVEGRNLKGQSTPAMRRVTQTLEPDAGAKRIQRDYVETDRMHVPAVVDDLAGSKVGVQKFKSDEGAPADATPLPESHQQWEVMRW